MLPDIDPLLLLIRQWPVGVAESVGENFTQTAVKNFQCEHGLPVPHGEADAICVDGDDARV